MKPILVLAGASGVGKSSVAEIILSMDERFELSRSVTTRPPRADSFDDEYIYLTDDELESLKMTGGMLEFTEYSGAKYGTPMSEIERIHGAGRIPLLVLDLQGVESIKGSVYSPGAYAVYLYASPDTLISRLEKRYILSAQNEEQLASGKEKLEKRKEQNERDRLALEGYKKHFDLILENEGDIKLLAKNILRSFDRFCEKS